MNQTGDSPESMEQARLAERDNVKNEIKELQGGNADSDEQTRLGELKGKLFDMSTEEESISDLQEAVDHYESLRDEDTEIQLAGIARYAWGDRAQILGNLEQVPKLKAGIEDMQRKNEWVVEDGRE